MTDLISVDQLTVNDIEAIHHQADIFFANGNQQYRDLENKLLINFFFENSTRTRMSFEIAMKRMGGKVLNVDISLSSLKKGESIIDMAKTLNAMKPDFVAIRHNSSGIVNLLKNYIEANLINAGDGTNEHPSQALLDSFVIKKHKKNLANLKIAICGDVLHSRVARSNIKLLKKFGCEIRVITPPTLIVNQYRNWLKEKFDIEVFEDLVSGIQGVDVIMMLRIQQERMLGCYIPSLSEYFKIYGLDYEKIKFAPNALVLHPGPINRDVEIASNLADDKNRSLILEQVSAGVAVRQSLLLMLNKN
jgi:aspartate carbamoyltransferase catalytic subunit